MLPINLTQTTPRFHRLVKRSKPNYSEDNDKEDSFEQTQRRLNNRLQAIRDKFEPGPLSGINNMNAEDLEILNDNASKRNRYGIVCPDCQDAYRKNSNQSKAVIPYRRTYNNVEISS